MENINKEFETRKLTLPETISGWADDALGRFSKKGFPSTRLEAWKYSDFDNLDSFTFNQEPLKSKTLPKFFQEQKNVIVVGENSIQQNFEEEGVYIWNFKEGIIDPSFEKIFKELNPSQDSSLFELNTGFCHGVCIGLAEKKHVTDPIYIVYQDFHPSSRRDVRNLVLATSFSKATIVEVYLGDTVFHCNAVTQVLAHDHAQIDLFVLQNQSIESVHTGSIVVHQKNHSQVSVKSFAWGGLKSRQDIEMHLLGKNSVSHIHAVFCPKGKQLMDHHTLVHHHVPHTESHENVKGILMDQSHGVFQGKVVVAKDAQKTNATQINRNLLLSPSAHIDTAPQLEILADDVKCSHGATIGKLDENQLFYLRSRGISLAAAQKMMVQGFVAEITMEIQNEALKSWIENAVEEALD